MSANLLRNLFFVLVGAAFALGIAAMFVLRPWVKSGYGPMTSAEDAAELANKGMRSQIVTFVDGLIPLPLPATRAEPEPEVTQFAVVVGQITLGDPEPVGGVHSGGSFRGFNGGKYGRLGMAYGAAGSSAFVQATTDVSGRFNNVLIYDKKAGTAKKVFDSRMSVTRLRLFSRGTRRVVAFLATSDDTNGDGRLDNDDLQKLLVYGLDDGALRAVTGLAASPTDLFEIEGVDYFVVEAATDTNKNGEIDNGGSPRVPPEVRLLYRVDLASLEVQPLIDPALVDELQGTLDGAKRSATKANR
ncbi:MAG: EF-hand domain-containing protein [Micropepsaceae bacterium]